LVLSDRKSFQSHDNTLAAYEYYPFGMLMQGYTSANYRYGFNGMERDDEVSGSGNSQDFGARMLDVRLGRFKSLDPLSKEYPSMSDYSFVANSPLMFVDPDGKRIYFVPGLGYKKKKGDSNSPYVKGISEALSIYLKPYNTYSSTVQGSYGGRLPDMVYVAMFGQKPRKNIKHDRRAMNIIKAIAQDVMKNPIDTKNGEQMNIVATSQGTVSAAQAAIAMVENPGNFDLPEDFVIDNLVLAGSPIDVNSELYVKLQELEVSGKIKNIRYDKYQADGDVVTGLAGVKRKEAFSNGKEYVKVIKKAIKEAKEGGEDAITDPHIRAAYDKPIDSGSGKESFHEEVIDKLETDEVH